MMAKEYKNRGGDYNTPKSDKDESQEHLDKWTEEEWQTKEGSGHAKKADGTQKRYLPKKAWEEMDEGEKEATDQKKQTESKQGKQFVGNTGRAKRARKNANEKEDEEYESRKEDHGGEDEDEEQSPEEEEKTQKANTGQKRGRPKKSADEANGDEPANKSQKTGKSGKGGGQKKVGSRKDNAEPPAKQASLKRLPKKGTQAYWKAMPGWVDGKVVEVLKAGKSVDG